MRVELSICREFQYAGIGKHSGKAVIERSVGAEITHRPPTSQKIDGYCVAGYFLSVVHTRAVGQRILERVCGGLVAYHALGVNVDQREIDAGACGYVDGIAAHETGILQYMKDNSVEFRILEEPLLVTGLGIAFAKNDSRGLDTQLNAVLAQMRADGTLEQIVGRYLEHASQYLEVDTIGA